jgi:hypothetical protein
MFTLCYEIVAHRNNILVKIFLSICKHQLLFTLAIPSFLYTNNNNNNGSRSPTLNKILKFPNEICVKNMRINLGWNSKINNTTVIDSKVMTTCMSPFSKPLLDFGLMPKKIIVTKNALLQMLLMHLYMMQFQPQSDCGQSYHVFNKSQCKYA